MAKGKGSGKTPDRVTELLKKAVERKSQIAVSRETGIPLFSIQKYLKGIAEPTTATLEKLAAWSMRPVAWLRGGSNDGGAYRGEAVESLVKRAYELIEIEQLVPERLKKCVHVCIFIQKEEILDLMSSCLDIYTYEEIGELHKAWTILSSVVVEI